MRTLIDIRSINFDSFPVFSDQIQTVGRARFFYCLQPLCTGYLAHEARAHFLQDENILLLAFKGVHSVLVGKNRSLRYVVFLAWKGQILIRQLAWIKFVEILNQQRQVLLCFHFLASRVDFAAILKEKYPLSILPYCRWLASLHTK